ncbi:uncharacterized protein LOC21395118 [Morus notabilis]|uniref:uncharacterized protein LOC21395118 n=1 Tax=Morus notabilis TaxID=981085 RepID=UPI000CED7675|nr:uncharacterized protein LOC21395118 [Morus notabilis]
MSNTGKTITPVEFEVNGINLAEIEGGEVATTNLHSCNGPDFVLQLHFSLKQASVTKSPGSRLYREANARLKFVYFPVVEGKESMEKILEKLKADGHEITDIYNTFSRVSVRRLGRLLPDARWASLPFMDLRHKKGSKAQILKTCCARVKCFIDIDAGINPTPSKTDLAHQNPFAIALRNFGNNTNENEKGIDIEVYRDGKLLSSSQVEKDYQDWILQMHMQYDEEVDHGEDQPVLIVSPAKGKEVGISSDVMRVHKVLKRKGVTWKSGQKIKILKGACAGVHKNNVYATLEYFLLGGFEGDAGGEARIICRPLGTSDENGCILSEHNGKTSLDKQSSLSIPVSVIDAEKCIPLEATEWNQLVEKHRQKCPSTIDLLSTKEYQELEIGGEELPAIVTAGKASPKEIVAVVRPANYGPQSDHLQQKYISKCKTEMLLEVKFNGANKDVGNGDHLCSWRVTPSSHKGIHGLYVFSLGRKFSNLFQKVGFYTFSFSLTDSSCKNFVKKVNVKASSEIRKWKVLSNNRSLPYSFRVGSFSGPPIVVACYDIYDNHTRFTSTPQVQVKIQAKEGILFHVKDFKPRVSYSGMELRVKDLLIQSSELDKIRPGYGATLVISSSDKLFSASIPCHVNPGCIEVVKTRPSILANQLIPGCIIKELKLEMFDGHGNHVMEGSEVQLNLEGFEILDQLGLNRKVDDCGGINLNGILKVTAGYGANVSFSVSSDNKVLIKQEFKIERRELRLVSKVPDVLMAGSILGNMVFEIVNSEGDVDETIHDEDKIGQSNLLTIKSDLDGMMESVRYTFKHGRCTVPVIPVPQREGSFCFSACHSRHSNLKLLVKVPLVKPAMPMVTPKLEYGKIQSTPSDGKILLLQDSSSPTQVENKIIMSIENKKKRLEHDLLCMGVSIGTLERTLGLLKEEKEKLEQMVKELQESTSVCLVDFQNCFCTKVELTEEIEKMGNSAAAALCKISRRVPFQEQQNDFMKDIIGVVALLGRVNSSQLSRILSEYLGLDQMLAVVTRSFEAANVLQKYKQNEGDCSDARLAEGVALLKSIKDRFTVFCLEDISPYVAAPECGGSQRNLPLPVPFIPDGTVPTGFLGFAVNMIDLDVDQLQIKTTSGHGLRETLFYGLFGQLQVYRTRDEMLAARACIKHGAVSLDGGILKENSGVTFGTRNPGICFQVVARETESVSGENVKLLAEKKSQLRELEQRIVVEMKTREKTIKKFKRMKSKYLKLADEMNPLLEDFYSEHGIQPTLTQETAGARRRD